MNKPTWFELNVFRERFKPKFNIRFEFAGTLKTQVLGSIKPDVMDRVVIYYWVIRIYEKDKFICSAVAMLHRNKLVDRRLHYTKNFDLQRATLRKMRQLEIQLTKDVEHIETAPMNLVKF